MRRLFLLFFMALFLPAARAGFTLQEIAPGVHVAVRDEPPSLAFVCNMVFIVNDDDVVVVDTGVGPESAREAIAALKAITPKPVTLVVNTHWHDDHLLGNAAFREAWPRVEFVAQARAPGEMAGTGEANRRQLLAEGPAFVARIEAALADGRNLQGATLTPGERLSMQFAVAWAARYFREVPGLTLPVPTLLVESRLTVRRGARDIEIRHLGRGHTASDLVVHLPREGVLIAGDLLVHPVPLVGSTSFPVDFAATLGKLADLKAAVIVPGHGPVMRDPAYLQRSRALLEDMVAGVRAAVAAGNDLAAARKAVDLAAHRRSFAGEDPLLKLLFDQYVAGPGIARAFAQLSGKLP